MRGHQRSRRRGQNSIERVAGAGGGLAQRQFDCAAAERGAAAVRCPMSQRSPAPQRTEIALGNARLSTPRIAVVLFGPQGRGGFNQAGLAGAERARTLHPALQVHWCEPAAPTARTAYLRQLCKDRTDLIVAHGGQGDAPVAAVAPHFHHTQFAITQGEFVARNVACYEVLQEQSAFLAGVLAAATTRSGVVAHLSGEKVRPGLKGRAAFASGVRHQDKYVRLLTTFCGDQHDADLAYRTVQAQADAGADVLFAMIDGGRDGAIRACRERGVAQIGNVLDWTAREPDVFIASALADSGCCIELAVEDFLAGRNSGGSKRIIGIEAEAHVRLALHPRVERATRDVVESFRAQLAARTLQFSLDYGGPEFTPER